MAESKRSTNVNDLLKQIEQFEKTLAGLSTNVGNLKKKLLEGRDKYGSDMNAWPKDAK